jgi:hypothetical protein
MCHRERWCRYSFVPLRPEQSASLSDADVGILDALGCIWTECQTRLDREEVRATTESLLG